MQGTCEGEKRPPRVVVVGAGFAGVGAARRLTEGGVGDVTVVEAAERPGGRVQTVVLDDGFVEMGAQYLHGETEIYHFCEKEGLLAEDEDDSDEEDFPDTLIQYSTFTFRMPGGRAINPKVVRKNLQTLEKLLDSAGTAVKDGAASGTDVSVSMGDFLETLYPQFMKQMAGDQPCKAAFIKWLEAWNVLDSAARVSQLSLPGVGRYVYEAGSGVQETRGGLWEVLQRLLKNSLLPLHRLLLAKPVQALHWNPGSPAAAGVVIGINNNNNYLPEKKSEPGLEDAGQADGGDRNPESERPGSNATSLVSQPSPVTDSEDVTSRKDDPAAPTFAPGESDYRVAVHCEDGDVIFADHVIVTPSIGFLREHQQFFVPGLPEKHQTAIRSVGFGTVAKVFLFWDLDAGDVLSEWRVRMLGSDVDGMIPLWPEGYHPEVKSARSSQPAPAGHPWYEDICMMEFVETCGACLLVWVHGEGADVMETVPETEVKDVLLELLMLFLGKPELPAPARLVRSQWHSNPYTRGSYSYLATGVPLELHDVLRQPLPSAQDPVLQLAGEACSKDHYSTAHGALYSGQAAADVILRHHNMLQ